MVSHPETGSDSPIGSDRDRGVTTLLWQESQHHQVTTLESSHVATLELHNVTTSRCWGVLLKHHVESHQVTSRRIVSHHVTSCHITSRHVTTQHRNVTTFWVWINNVAALDANVATLLEIYEQRRDVGHERHDVAEFSSNHKVSKIQSLGLLHTLKLFFLHINHPRSSHDHILQEKHWI